MMYRKIFQFSKIVFLMSAMHTLTSCSFVMKKMVGLKNPKVETRQSVADYLTECKIPLENSYVLKGRRDSAVIFNNLLRGFHGEVLIYQNNGTKYCYNGTDKCSGKQLKQAYDKFNEAYKPCTNDTGKFQSLLAAMDALVPGSGLKKSDYFLIVYWSKYFGRKSRLVEDYKWMQGLKNASGTDIAIILVNTDLLNEWGLKEGKRMKMKFKRRNKQSASLEFGDIPFE